MHKRICGSYIKGIDSVAALLSFLLELPYFIFVQPWSANDCVFVNGMPRSVTHKNVF